MTVKKLPARNPETDTYCLWAGRLLLTGQPVVHYDCPHCGYHLITDVPPPDLESEEFNRGEAEIWDKARSYAIDVMNGKQGAE